MAYNCKVVNSIMHLSFILIICCYCVESSFGICITKRLRSDVLESVEPGMSKGMSQAGSSVELDKYFMKGTEWNGKNPLTQSP